MFCVSWHGPGGYDRFICVDESEMQVIVNHYGDPEAAAWGRSGHYYYLLCDEKRILTPLKRPALARKGLECTEGINKEDCCQRTGSEILCTAAVRNCTKLLYEGVRSAVRNPFLSSFGGVFELSRPLEIKVFKPVQVYEAVYSSYHIGRAHRSHRWGHRFESCCDHVWNRCKITVFFL